MSDDTTIRVFKYRLYPTKLQEATMFNTLRLTRTLYNAALEQRIAAYKKQGKTVTGYDQQKELTALKAECPEFAAVYSHVLQEPLERLDKAFKGFFSRLKQGKKAGFPRFKPMQRWTSFKFKEVWDKKKGRWLTPGRPTDDGKRINIPKIGSVKCKFHRPLEGVPKNLQVVHDCGEWYAVYTCEVPQRSLPATGSSVGVDVGTTWFAITSDGEFVENPRHLQKNLRKLRIQQRTVARRKKGGNRRKKAVKLVAKTHQRIRRARLDFHHKTARRLVNEHDVIAHEDLKVSNMVKSNLARSISDVGWSQFFDILALKAEEAARRVIRVDPRYTSQTCHQCGHRCKENRLSQSRFRCVVCGHEDNADLNAARNILRAGTRPSGVNDKEGIYVVA
ncbi:RNA-guided endonuclease InsQ/TnpB family protein [Deinococcus sp. Marseille-Q6407]|uniref:RNA-guided endonuclease InsQ/TnpB family protein n=1 Tax=Deinococcus sp. Marseille-Q6407 TaxID=2969223 RepID=UPI0021BF41C4|nr:transposase [Deinococcus sp. Marseille-Q6407]